MTAAPEHTHALIVGVERYAAGPTWDLPGPASDALRFHDWLRRRGVPAENVVLLLSPSEGFSPEPPYAHRGAAYEKVRRAFTTELAARRGSLLWVWWGGHGVLDRDEHLRLFCADATVADKRNLDLESARRSLATDAVEGFAQQIWIVDSCQTFMEDLRFVHDLPAEALPAGRRVIPREQVLLLSAARGQRAANDPVRRTGLFSDLLLAALEQSPTALWPPDARQLHRDVEARLAELRTKGLADQLPTFSFRGPGLEVRLDPPAHRAGSAATMTDVVEVLLDYPMTADPVQRQTLVALLPAAAVERMPRHHIARTDVVMIVGHLSQRPEQLWSLYEAVRMLDADERRGAVLESAVRGLVGPQAESV